jgi:signal transduction histidine kinase
MLEAKGGRRAGSMGRPALRTAAALGFLAVLNQPAAAALKIPALSPALIFAGLAGLAALGIGLNTLRRLSRAERAARARVADLEHQLNEAEAALAAEAHVLLTWRSREAVPDRMIDSLHGLVKLPPSAEAIIDFASWLEPDSAAMIGEGVAALRTSGKAFNIGVRTLAGDLLEADGRAAGGQATLRFRPLSGERQQITELAYDARKLGKQIERLSAILDAAPIPIWIRGADRALTWVNRAYVRSTDLADSTAVIKAQFELAKTDRIDTAKADPAINLAGRAHTILGGSLHALNIHEVPLTSGVAGFAIDVTPLEEAEKELDRHIKAHTSTLNKLDTAIAIFGPDQRLRFFNQAFAKLWPLDEKWLESWPSDGDILDRLRAQRCIPEQANYREWRARQLSSYTTLEMRENYWYLPDGRSLHVVCEQHPFGGVTYLYENLTREIQLESRYNELIGVQRETLDNLAEAIALIGSDGRLKLFNPAFTTFWKFDPQSLAQEPHVEALARHPALGDEARAIWQDIKFGITGLESNRKPMEGRVRQAERILQYSAVPLPDGNTLLSFADISDPAKIEQALRERAEALEAADKLKSTFLTNVSYEVRTPLTSILGFAETLDIGIAGALTAKQREYVLDIRRSSEDLKAIIDAIIDLSAIDAGAMELKPVTISVEEALGSVAERLSPLLLKRKIAVSIEVADNATTLKADPTRLEQILGQLLSNAIGFSPEGSTIRMGARRTGTLLQIWVADTGRGMDPDFQKRAFDRFQSKPLPGGHRGPGLGLALVKSLTELHGGKVSLVSKLDQGTTVVVSLPAEGPQRSEKSGSRADGPGRAA